MVTLGIVGQGEPEMKTKLVIGLVLLVLLSVIPVANAYTIEPLDPEPEYPIRDRIIVPRLLLFKANLYLQEDEVWIKLSVMNHAKYRYSFVMVCHIPCISPSWGYAHIGGSLEPHKKFVWLYKVRPCEDGGRESIVPVDIVIYTSYHGIPNTIYLGDFTLEIPADWDYIVTA